ncbi:tetratricopeptide repeat protein [Aeromonas cavernicola]|uniref:Uncharacterized protein n=1 Tax=Aeromonas cavernicola TaxID=1006623 RepID=A0A2H9U2A8_9GAMM|nr:tetratricopeptide repeat protein [Aeromonas cavernicola]PJG58165.1 hypothetical protein CUC53_14160 [Aeromonas cavernicola]
MSVINQMLKELEQRPQETSRARYVPMGRQSPRGMLLLALSAGLVLGVAGWSTWSSRLSPEPQPAGSEPDRPDAVARVVAPVAARPVASQPDADVAAMLPLLSDEQGQPAAIREQDPSWQAPASDAANDMAERVPTDEELQPDLYAELATEQQITAAVPQKPSVLKIETVELSTQELAALAERKAAGAMAKGNLRDAQDHYYQVLAHDPHNQGAREQLAGLLYGEGRLTEARQLLEEGLRLTPQQADFRLLLARLAISEAQLQQALSWLAGYQPDLANNLDYYATWAGLSQELGLNAEAAALYVKLLRQQPDQGRWWLGLGVAEDGQGNRQRALDAYRNAQLHGKLGEESANWLAQRIAQLAL